MVEYQEHHLGGGGCLIKAAFKQGDFGSIRSPGSLSLPASGYVSHRNHPFQVLGISVVGLVLASAVPKGTAGVPNRILDMLKKVEPFQVTRRLNR